jgi:hypothetical protein
MDEIIYLEIDEEITSVIDKLKNSQNVSIGLAVPRGATLLQSVVNLRLIAREAKALNKQISIVTTDKIGRNLAAQVGLPIYNSVREEHPVYVAPPVSAREQDEIIEIEPQQETSRKTQEIEERLAQANQAESSGSVQSVRNKIHVNHFQEDKPVVNWRSGERPVLKKEREPEISKTAEERQIERNMDRKAKKVIWPILIVLFLLIGIGAYLLFPAANIQVFVKSEDLTKTLPIIFTNSVTKPDYTQNFFPGVLVEAKKEQSQKFQTTGKKNSGGKSTGSVSFYNGLDSLSHKYAAGSKVVSDGKTFLLKTALVIPGATVQNLKVLPGSAVADVEAENAGEDYNIKAGKFVIVGLAANQQAAIYGESKADLKGGFTKTVSIISKEDYENAKKQLTDTLLTGLDTEIKNKSEGLSLIDKSQVMLEPEITSSSSIDQEATEFEMKVSLTKQVMAYNYKDLLDFITLAMAKQVPVDKMVVIASTDAIGFVIDKQAYDKGELDTTLNVAAKIATKMDVDKLKNDLLGKSRKSAEQFVLVQPGVEKVDFVFNPTWLAKVSELSRNVKIEVKYITQ